MLKQVRVVTKYWNPARLSVVGCYTPDVFALNGEAGNVCVAELRQALGADIVTIHGR